MKFSEVVFEVILTLLFFAGIFTLYMIGEALCF
jgi:hypothetical protein